MADNCGRSIDNSFYRSPLWKKTRDLYLKSVDGLCEECLAKGIYKPAYIVHHIVHLTPELVEIPEYAVGFSNLKALCLDCHNKIHFKKKNSRYSFNEKGEIVMK